VAFFSETADCNKDFFFTVVVHEKYPQNLQEFFSPVNAAAITRERLTMSVVLKLFQFPEHLTVMLLSMEHVKILFSCYSKYRVFHDFRA